MRSIIWSWKKYRCPQQKCKQLIYALNPCNKPLISLVSFQSFNWMIFSMKSNFCLTEICCIIRHQYNLVKRYCWWTVYLCTCLLRGGHSPPFFKIPFLPSEFQDVPTFYRPIGKTKVFVFNFDPQSIVILEEYLQKCKMQTWYNVFKSFLVNFMKSGCHLEKGI